jgi:hypothetical protein
MSRSPAWNARREIRDSLQEKPRLGARFLFPEIHLDWRERLTPCRRSPNPHRRTASSLSARRKGAIPSVFYDSTAGIAGQTCSPTRRVGRSGFAGRLRWPDGDWTHIPLSPGSETPTLLSPSPIHPAGQARARRSEGLGRTCAPLTEDCQRPGSPGASTPRRSIDLRKTTGRVPSRRTRIDDWRLNPRRSRT